MDTKRTTFEKERFDSSEENKLITISAKVFYSDYKALTEKLKIKNKAFSLWLREAIYKELSK